VSRQLDLCAAGDAVMIRSWAACSSLPHCLGLCGEITGDSRGEWRGREARGVGITIYLQRDINLSELWIAQCLPLPAMCVL
jgi:hypothetical protein